jgi:DNA-binding MarR family transcriptional regulator
VTARGPKANEPEHLPPSAEELFRELSARTVLFHETVAEHLGINATDRHCLDLLERSSREGPVTAGKLSELTGLTSGAITGVLDRLERAGFVKREKDPGDRRQVQIKLVGARVQELAALFAPLSAGYAALTSSLTAQQLSAVIQFLEGASALLMRETERLKGHEVGSTAAATPGEELSAPLAGAQHGQFELTRGASNVTLGSLRGGLLYRIRHEGPAPRVRLEGGQLQVEYQRSALRMLAFGKHALQIDLNERLPWQLRFKGGANKLSANLRQLKLKSVELLGGATHTSFELPPVSEIVPLRIGGGVQHVSIRRPKQTPLRIVIEGGASQLQIDTLELGAVGGRVHWQTPDFESSSLGYDVLIGGGASHLSIAMT